MSEPFINLTSLSCHGCGYQMDAASCLRHPSARLKPRDLSMCLNCGFVYEFSDPGWRRLTRKERRALPGSIKDELALMELGRAWVIRRDLSFEQALEKWMK